MFANVKFRRTKGEEIKLTDDDIDNGVDVVMPDDDDDWSVIKNTITETLPRSLEIRCEVMELVMWSQKWSCQVTYFSIADDRETDTKETFFNCQETNENVFFCNFWKGTS